MKREKTRYSRNGQKDETEKKSGHGASQARRQKPLQVQYVQLQRRNSRTIAMYSHPLEALYSRTIKRSPGNDCPTKRTLTTQSLRGRTEEKADTEGTRRRAPRESTTIAHLSCTRQQPETQTGTHHPSGIARTVGFKGHEHGCPPQETPFRQPHRFSQASDPGALPDSAPPAGSELPPEPPSAPSAPWFLPQLDPFSSGADDHGDLPPINDPPLPERPAPPAAPRANRPLPPPAPPPPVETPLLPKFRLEGGDAPAGECFPDGPCKLPA